MLRIVTSLNWAVGALIVGGVLLYALVSDAFIVGKSRTTVEDMVKSIAKAERNHFALREEYVYFVAEEPWLGRAMDKLGLDKPPADFRFEAFSDAKNAIVIRAFTSIPTLRDGWVPPLMYEYKIKSATETGEGGWVDMKDLAAGSS